MTDNMNPTYCRGTGYSKPCLNDVVERHDGVTVEVLRCRRCGKQTIQWKRPEIATLEDSIAEAAASAPNAAPEPRDYWEAVEHFLRTLQNMKVRSLGLVALVDDEEAHDVVCTYDSSPWEIASMAGLLQLHAANREREDREEAEDDPG